MGITGPHFSDSELACKGTNCGPVGTGCHVNNCTQGLIDALEAFRAKVGKPVRVHDAFRCVKHNMGVTGAAKDSQHPNGRAADISVDGVPAAELERIARTIPEIRGIGRNDRQNYIHIDVRPGVTLAQWCYDEKGKWCAYKPPLAVA